jgi:hypothetical protein
MWLIPLVWGWFAVGTHHGRREQVVERLRESAKDIALITKGEVSRTEDGIITICDPREDIKWITTDTPQFEGDFPKRRRSIFGFSIAGDELSDGPFYNYARSSTWSHLCSKTVLACVDARKQPPPIVHIPPANNRGHATNAYEGDLSRTQSHEQDEDLKLLRLGESGFAQNGPLRRFAWKESTGSDVGSGYRKAQAFIMASVLQGIFGWSAFMIDYTTPTIGIGCRAFICMTYSLTSLSSCVLLIIGSHCADSWSFQHEHYQWSIKVNPGLSRAREPEPNATLSMIAVGCRLLGKTLAILNAMFIVVGCVLEFAGVYESCFCKSSYFGLRSRAYISFLSTNESVQIARPYWFGGAGAAMLTVLIICFGYFTKVYHRFR